MGACPGAGRDSLRAAGTRTRGSPVAYRCPSTQPARVARPCERASGRQGKAFRCPPRRREARRSTGATPVPLPLNLGAPGAARDSRRLAFSLRSGPDQSEKVRDLCPPRKGLRLLSKSNSQYSSRCPHTSKVWTIIATWIRATSQWCPVGYLDRN